MNDICHLRLTLKNIHHHHHITHFHLSVCRRHFSIGPVYKLQSKSVPQLRVQKNARLRSKNITTWSFRVEKRPTCNGWWKIAFNETSSCRFSHFSGEITRIFSQVSGHIPVRLTFGFLCWKHFKAFAPTWSQVGFHLEISLCVTKHSFRQLVEATNAPNDVLLQSQMKAAAAGWFNGFHFVMFERWKEQEYFQTSWTVMFEKNSNWQISRFQSRGQVSVFACFVSF